MCVCEGEIEKERKREREIEREEKGCLASKWLIDFACGQKNTPKKQDGWCKEG